MTEVVQNDYNLNTSRYVFIAEAQPSVDLAQVQGGGELTPSGNKRLLGTMNFLQRLGLHELK